MKPVLSQRNSGKILHVAKEIDDPLHDIHRLIDLGCKYFWGKRGMSQPVVNFVRLEISK